MKDENQGRSTDNIMLPAAPIHEKSMHVIIYQPDNSQFISVNVTAKSWPVLSSRHEL
jgi:hypothetical protein